MKTTTLIGEVVLEYLNKFPNYSSLGLARMIYRDNVALFKDVESVRTAIRYYRGTCGENNRKKITNKTHVKQI